ncbi:MAG: DUF2796 domain-containing protein [Desulfovibrio sp.]|jgi:hypothetical protein|nr:DUF2796 domain-containing protein [Desulfovibrio sp.]
MRKILVFCAVIGCFWGFESFSSTHEAHEHGLVHMNLVVEGGEVKIDISGALDNFLSFEHKPETDAQRKEVRNMAALLRNSGVLFVFPAEARCRPEEVSLDSEVLGQALLAPEGSKQREAHGHGGESHEDHGDLDAEISFMCLDPKNLNSVTVNMFSVFPNLRRMEVQMVTSRGQNAAKLSPEANVVRW